MDQSVGDGPNSIEPGPPGSSFDGVHASAPPGLALFASPVITAAIDRDSCLVCLELLEPSEIVTAEPCRHAQWHLSCLATWLEVNQVCPLCKSVVTRLKYLDQGAEACLELPQLESARRQKDPALRLPSDFHAVRRRRRRDFLINPARDNEKAYEDRAVAFRQHVYRHNLYSLHVGATSRSGYRNVTPRDFIGDGDSAVRLRRRARAWIRRELQVFGFLDPTSNGTRQPHLASSSTSISPSYSTASSSSASPPEHRSSGRARPAPREYLLEYVLNIIQHVDIRGSSGQAQEMLAEHLGREHAWLFLHELYGFLRSPYERVSEWDARVQYADLPGGSGGSGNGDDEVHATRDLQVAGEGSGDGKSTVGRDVERVPAWFSDGFVLDETERAPP